MASTPMDLDAAEPSSPAHGTSSASLNITRNLGGGLPSTSAVTDVISNFRPTKLFGRNDSKDGRPKPHVLSLDYDDPGELLMASMSDETIQIYKVREGRFDKQLLSKKYGVKLAKFTHASSGIIYASTKVNDAIRYLTTHDNAFIRYFEGHEGAVTDIAMHPGADDFISCSKDNTIRLWNAGTKNATAVLYLNTPYLSAWDPSGQVFAVASPTGGSILLYDRRHFDKAPFSTIDIVEACHLVDPQHVMKGWTKLEFSNNGKWILLGTEGGGHVLLDAFANNNVDKSVGENSGDGLRAYLEKPNGSTGRLAPGEDFSVNGGSSSNDANFESSGDCCFTSDGRYVLSGASKQDVLVWDTLDTPGKERDAGEKTLPGDDKILAPKYTLKDEREAAVLAWNPRYNFFTTADQDVVFWIPDWHA